MEDREEGAEASYSPFNWSPPNYAGITAGRLAPGHEIAPGPSDAD